MSTFRSGSDTTRSAAQMRAAAEADEFTLTEPEKPPRDWKKLFLVVGLGLLSWVATYVGMLELIEANMGDLPLVHQAIIGFSVAMLMTMIIWLLDQLFAPIGLFTKTLYAAGYVFLTVISVGFGFGFYWKVLESKSEASRSAEGAVGQVQGSLFAASTRLDQLQGTLDTLTTISRTKAQQETATGTSCPNSRPGEGPRRKLREDDAARFQFASEFVKGRAGQVKTEMTSLDADFAKISAGDKAILDQHGTRNEFMKGLSRKLDNTVTGFNAFRSDPQLKQIRQDLAERGDKTTFPDSKGGSFQCPDSQLSGAIKGVVRAIDELPVMEKPKIAAVEGSEATIEAFRRLQATMFGALSFKLPPSADELRDLQKKAVQSVESQQGSASARALAVDQQPGLSKRDYVPLAIAIFVDICLLLVSMGRPINRMQGLVPKMREAERGPVYQILSRFSDIHKDEETREKFELFRHVVFDFNGDYYVAVPLDAPYRYTQRNAPRVEKLHADHVRELQLEASMLANLFASFEKEKIFTRVYNPMLSTKAIQKRLLRQGSKFAQSQAFRVYRFKDGAWSEIILGAVMGAAKRVEAEKRRRRVEEEIFQASAREHVLTGGRPHDGAPERTGLELPGLHVPLGASQHASRRATDSEGRRRPQSTSRHGEDPSDLLSDFEQQRAAQFGPYSQHVKTSTETSRVDQPAPRPLDVARQAAKAPRMSDFEADVSVHAANSNTLPFVSPPAPEYRRPADRTQPPNVISLPQARAGGQTPRGGDGAMPTPSSPSPRAMASSNGVASAAGLAVASIVAEPGMARVDVERVAADAHPDTSVDAEPMVNVTLVERRASYSIPSSAAAIPAEVLRQVTGARRAVTVEAAAPAALASRGGAVGNEGADEQIDRLGAALRAIESPEWQAEQKAALGGKDHEDQNIAPSNAVEASNGDIVWEGFGAGDGSRDDMGRMAARFAPDLTREKGRK